MLSITGDMQRDAQLWSELPELAGIAATGGAKPGATVLARHPQTNPADEQGRGYPVLVIQPFGQGRAAVLAAETTWQWSRFARLSGRPDTLYVRFWSQMMRHLARREQDGDRTALTVGTDAASYERGQRVSIRVRRNPTVIVPGLDDRATDLAVSIRTPDGRTVRAAVEPSASNSNLWNASFFPERGGTFEVIATLIADTSQDAQRPESRTFANEQTRFVVEGSQLELSDPATNPAALRQIAQLTGGAYAELHEPRAVESILAVLPQRERVVQRAQTTQVWNSPILFIVFLALVTLEWLLRRRSRLV